MLFNHLAEMVTSVAIIGDIVQSAGQLLTDDDFIILPHHQDDARKRIGDYLHSMERADTLLQHCHALARRSVRLRDELQAA